MCRESLCGEQIRPFQFGTDPLANQNHFLLSDARGHERTVMTPNLVAQPKRVGSGMISSLVSTDQSTASINKHPR